MNSYLKLHFPMEFHFHHFDLSYLGNKNISIKNEIHDYKNKLHAIFLYYVGKDEVFAVTKLISCSTLEL